MLVITQAISKFGAYPSHLIALSEDALSRLLIELNSRGIVG